jgi:hypothetical protein
MILKIESFDVISIFSFFLFIDIHVQYIAETILTNITFIESLCNIEQIREANDVRNLIKLNISTLFPSYLHKTCPRNFITFAY